MLAVLFMLLIVSIKRGLDYRDCLERHLNFKNEVQIISTHVSQRITNCASTQVALEM